MANFSKISKQKLLEYLDLCDSDSVRINILVDKLVELQDSLSELQDAYCEMLINFRRYVHEPY